jgi:hypothetical protein
MQFPKTVRLLLIAQPSFNLWPSAPLYPAFSDPARSTKYIIDNFSVFLNSSSIIYLNSIVIIVCARLDVWFINVAPILLFVYPSSILVAIVLYESTGCFDNPWTYTSPFLSSLTFNDWLTELLTSKS